MTIEQLLTKLLEIDSNQRKGKKTGKIVIELELNYSEGNLGQVYHIEKNRKKL